MRVNHKEEIDSGFTRSELAMSWGAAAEAHLRDPREGRDQMLRLTAIWLAALLFATGCARSPATIRTAATPTPVTVPSGPPAQPTGPIVIDNAVRAGLAEVPHSGNLLFAGGIFYWYGDTYRCGFRYEHAETPWCGFQVAWSSDLVTWHGPTLLFDPMPWQATCRGSGCFRPKVVYNARTASYVLWFNTKDSYRVLTGSSPLGPFFNPITPDLHDSGFGDYEGKPAALDGDEGLFVQGTRAYVAYDRSGALMIEQLTADFRNGAGKPVQVLNFPDVKPWHGVEAPSMFRRADTYYITMSLPRCPYCQAGTGVETARAPMGPWTFAGTISENSCGGQPDGVTQLPDGTYLYASDQWIHPPDWPYTNEQGATQFWTPLSFAGSRILSFGCKRQFTLSGITSGR